MKKRIRKLTLLLGLSILLIFGTGRTAFCAEETGSDSRSGDIVTPEIPNEPDTPENPNTPQIPDTPENPENPDTPENPENPEDPETPENPENPETPENPENPETPENPENPDTPENPEDPETPENPEDPETPENPEDPETPENPENPETPENPENPETPEDPGISENPETPENPEDPETPEILEDPETTETPENPEDPETPEDPENPGTSENPDDAGPIEKVQDMIHFIGDYAAGHSYDAILVESNGYYGLIDSSNPSNSHLGYNDDSGMNGAKVAEYLREIGVLHLDFIIGTHSHSDHIGGIPDIAAALNAQGASFVDEATVYIFKDYDPIKYEENIGWHNGDHFKLAVNAMAGQGATLLHVNKPTTKALAALGAKYEKDKKLSLADRITFAFGDYQIRLFNLHTASKYGENLNSICTLITKAATETDPERKILLTADLESSFKLEQKLTGRIKELYGTVDIMKAGHHSSWNAGSREALENMKPAYYLVSKCRREENFLAGYHYLTEQGTEIYFQNEQHKAMVADLTEGDIRILTYNEAGELAAQANRYVQTKCGWFEWCNDKITNDYDKYYVKEDHTLARGWTKIGSYWYYFSDTGKMQKGWKKRGDSWGYLNSSGKAVTGKQKIKNKLYFFTSDGIMQRGLISYGGKSYFAGEDGVVSKGWKSYGGQKAYVKSDGTVSTGRVKIGKKYYLFSSDGILQKNCWVKIGSKYYYANGSGVPYKGWKKINGSWYYMNSKGYRVTGKQKIKKKIYYFASDGVMRTGAFRIGTTDYLVGDDGAVHAGWKKIKVSILAALDDDTQAETDQDTGETGAGNEEVQDDASNTAEAEEVIRIYVRSNGTIAKGRSKVGKKYYLFNSTGGLTSGWLNYRDNWYFANSKGLTRSGWTRINGKIYYFNKNGIMLTGRHKINKKTYTFNVAGELISGKPPAVKVKYTTLTEGPVLLEE